MFDLQNTYLESKSKCRETKSLRDTKDDLAICRGNATKLSIKRNELQGISIHPLDNHHHHHHHPLHVHHRNPYL